MWWRGKKSRGGDGRERGAEEEMRGKKEQRRRLAERGAEEEMRGKKSRGGNKRKEEQRRR